MVSINQINPMVHASAAEEVRQRVDMTSRYQLNNIKAETVET